MKWFLYGFLFLCGIGLILSELFNVDLSNLDGRGYVNQLISNVPDIKVLLQPFFEIKNSWVNLTTSSDFWSVLSNLGVMIGTILWQPINLVIQVIVFVVSVFTWLIPMGV